MLEDKDYNFSLTGETKNRERVIIGGIYVTRNSLLRTTSDVKFLARNVEVSYKTISTKDQLWIEYGIINLDLRRVLPGYIGKITFSPLEDHEEVVGGMKAFKIPLLSGFIDITDTNIGKFESFDSYFNTVDETIGKVLELLSLAHSTHIAHCLIRIYTKRPDSCFPEKYNLRNLIMRYTETGVPVFGQALIEDLEDLYRFISNTLPKCTDGLKRNFDLDLTIGWYLESLSHSIIQSEYLLACTCLELLKDRHNKKIGNEYVFSKSSFEECLPDLKEKINEILKAKGVNNKKRKKISGNLECIKRTSFKSSLSRLLQDYHIIYDDLFPDVQNIIDNRNQITHSGTQEGTPEELSDVYEKLICLIQRIFLALLEYDGYFLDRNDRYERKKFTDFITVKSDPIRR